MADAAPQTAPAAPHPDGMPPGLPRLLAVATITIGLTMSVLSNSMTNLALPYMAHDLGITAESSIWIVNAYQIALMVTLLPVAALADIVGYRHVYRFGLAFFCVASLGCVLAPSLPWLIAARAVQGLAGSAIAPIQLVTPYMGQFLIFKAFALVIIGGLGNIPGAVAAAIALGLIESWIGGFFTIAWQEAAVFVIMIVVLFLRPDGLFKRGGMRVG